MSGFIAVAFAGLLLQSPNPVPERHPSTLRPYQPPAIRPFEPPSNFGRETEQGDSGEGAAHRRAPLPPLTVEAYAGQYEFTPSTSEAAYDQGVAAAEIRMDATAGPLDGLWRAGDWRLALVDPGDGRPVEGAWSDGRRMGTATVEAGRVALEDAGVVLAVGDLARP